MSWTMFKNKNYWNAKAVKLQSIHFAVEKSPSTAYYLYQDGKLDTASLSSQASKNLQKSPDYVVRKTNGTTYFQFNLKMKKFQSTKMRQAISMALDRNALAKTLGGGYTGSKNFTAAGMTKVGDKDFTDLSQTKESLLVTGHHKQLAQSYFKERLKELGLKKLSFTVITAHVQVHRRILPECS